MFSTWDCAGGAAKAAFRLHEALRGAGVDSRMLVKTRASALPSVAACAGESEREFIRWGRLEEDLINRNRSAISGTYFSVGQPGVDLSEHPWVQAADVLHLHWVTGFQSAGSIARLLRLGKPVVWSFHDQRAFTGGCHFSAGCRKYETDCAPCPQLREDRYGWPAAQLADQAEFWSGHEITVVAPSRWMGECARRSRLFARARIEVIPYGVETDRYLPADRAALRRALGWPVDGCYLLFGAERVGERRKGFAELRAALQQCAADTEFRARLERGEIQLVCFGRATGELAAAGVPVRALGYIGADTEMARLYAAADLFVLPSLEDNLPNTILEAMSCGTPVVAFAVGGVPDLATDGVHGRLVPLGDVGQLCDAIRELVGAPARLVTMGRQCRQRVETAYAVQHQAAAMRQLYHSLLNATRELVPQTGARGLIGSRSALALAQVAGDSLIDLNACKVQIDATTATLAQTIEQLRRLRQSKWVRFGRKVRLLKYE